MRAPCTPLPAQRPLPSTLSVRCFLRTRRKIRALNERLHRIYPAKTWRGRHLQLRQSVHFSGRCVRLTVKEGVRLFSEYKSKDLAYVGGTETKDRCSCSAWPSMLGGPAEGRRLSIALPRGMMVSLTVCFHGTMTQKETFMRKLLGHLLLFGVISSATLPKTVSADEPATGQADIAVAQNKCLGRGVNVLGYDPLWKDGQKARFQERYFRLIKEAGFSHIRVNLHPFRDNKLGPGNNLRAAWFETLDWTLKHALADNQEADGTIYDRVGTVGSYRSQGYCDSTDDKARFTDLPIAPDAEVHAVSSHASVRDKWATKERSDRHTAGRRLAKAESTAMMRWAMAIYGSHSSPSRTLTIWPRGGPIR